MADERIRTKRLTARTTARNAQNRLEGLSSRKVTRLRGASNKGVSRGVDRDGIALVEAAPAQKGGVGQGGAVRAQLAHKSVTLAGVGGLEDQGGRQEVC